MNRNILLESDNWLTLALKLFHPVMAGDHLVCLADGIKAPKEGRKMPGVKLLHQVCSGNTKPEYIMGHSLHRGRPRRYGAKVRLKDLFHDAGEFVSAPSPVYGENNVTLHFRCLDLHAP